MITLDVEPRRLVVTAQEAGRRLDRVLGARDLPWSRSTLQRWIEAGRVEVDGELVRSRAHVKAGAVVVIRPCPSPASEAAPEDIPLEVLHEDPHLLVLNKPAGLVVHPAPGHRSGTLVNALLHHARLCDGGDPGRPGIVHRLDKDTSGVMVVAKTVPAREGLVALFSSHDIDREYHAIALGALPSSARYDTLIGRHPRDRKRFSTRVTRGKRAVTHVRRIEVLHGAALVACRLETGRTHQVRVHLADHGFPLLGDPVYGRSSRDPRLRAAALALGRQALHAAQLGFRHPLTGAPLCFRVPPPADFQEAAGALRP